MFKRKFTGAFTSQLNNHFLDRHTNDRRQLSAVKRDNISTKLRPPLADSQIVVAYEIVNESAFEECKVFVRLYDNDSLHSTGYNKYLPIQTIFCIVKVINYEVCILWYDDF